MSDGTARFWRDWLPVIMTAGLLVGTAFVAIRDATEAKDTLRIQGSEIALLRISDARQDESLKAISRMENDLSRLTSYVLSRARREP